MTSTFGYVSKFAFIVDGDVGMTLAIGNHELQVQHTECLRNNPEIVEVEPGEGYVAKFNFVNDGVVNYTMDCQNLASHARFIACLRSNPTIVEVEPSHPVRGGWTYDGTDFHPPA